MWTTAYWKEELPLPRADLILLILSFATAIVDAFTFDQLGVFVANMTGNSVFLGLGLAGITDEAIHPTRSIVALVCFWTGSFVTGRLAARFGAKVRLYLFLQFASQALLILLPALLIFNNIVDNTDNLNLGIIVPMAFAFGSQAASGRPLGVPAITTVVVTSAMVDLLADKDLFVGLRKNLGRNQRAGFVVVFFLGGVVGALVLRHVGPPWALILSAIIKMGAALLLLALPGNEAMRKIVEVGSIPTPPATSSRDLETAIVESSIEVEPASKSKAV